MRVLRPKRSIMQPESPACRQSSESPRFPPTPRLRRPQPSSLWKTAAPLEAASYGPHIAPRTGSSRLELTRRTDQGPGTYRPRPDRAKSVGTPGSFVLSAGWRRRDCRNFSCIRDSVGASATSGDRSVSPRRNLPAWPVPPFPPFGFSNRRDAGTSIRSSERSEHSALHRGAPAAAGAVPPGGRVRRQRGQPRADLGLPPAGRAGGQDRPDRRPADRRVRGDRAGSVARHLPWGGVGIT